MKKFKKKKSKCKNRGNQRPEGSFSCWSLILNQLLLPGECCEVASEVIELDRLRLAVMLSWLWLVGG